MFHFANFVCISVVKLLQLAGILILSSLIFRFWVILGLFSICVDLGSVLGCF